MGLQGASLDVAALQLAISTDLAIQAPHAHSSLTLPPSVAWVRLRRGTGYSAALLTWFWPLGRVRHLRVIYFFDILHPTHVRVILRLYRAKVLVSSEKFL